MQDDPENFEHILSPPNNRRLHYSSAGNPQSNLVVLFFSGYLSIGTTSDTSLPAPIKSLGAHYIAPTLHGNGRSSSTPVHTHSDWGFEPAKLDEQHVNGERKILVVNSDGDDLGGGMAKWLVGNYKFATLRTIEGGHLAAMYHLDSIYEELLAGSSKFAVDSVQ